MIEIRHLRKEYGDSVPLRDINAVINDGDIIAVIGPSGTGKSTLLNCMNLLERPTSGQILLNGEDITGEGCDVSLVRRKMGMVFQSYHLFGHMTAVENVMFAPVKLLHLGRQEAYDRAVELLRMVGLAEKQMNYPDQMSGGNTDTVTAPPVLKQGDSRRPFRYASKKARWHSHRFSCSKSGFSFPTTDLSGIRYFASENPICFISRKNAL